MPLELSSAKLKSLYQMALTYAPLRSQNPSLAAYQHSASEARMLWLIKHTCKHNQNFKKYMASCN